jgi:uncharacterized protein (TIGR02466 family)
MSKTKRICKAAEQVKEVVQSAQLEVAYHFPCPIYLIERPDFLENVSKVSEESLEIRRKEHPLDDIYPMIMSDNYFADQRIVQFTEFVGSTAWNILSEQGYAMQDKVVQFTEMWTQEHYKQSSMEQHTHGYGSQIVGFYFLEVPENSSRVVFHDPRMGKSLIDLPETDISQATVASRMINFEPKPGLLIFSNAWLAHSFTRHASDKPIKFVHFNFNIGLAQNISCPAPAAEII